MSLPLIGKKSRRAPKLLALLALGLAGAAALSGNDVKRYLRMRSM